MRIGAILRRPTVSHLRSSEAPRTLAAAFLKGRAISIRSWGEPGRWARTPRPLYDSNFT